MKYRLKSGFSCYVIKHCGIQQAWNAHKLGHARSAHAPIYEMYPIPQTNRLLLLQFLCLLHTTHYHLPDFATLLLSSCTFSSLLSIPFWAIYYYYTVFPPSSSSQNQHILYTTMSPIVLLTFLVLLLCFPFSCYSCNETCGDLHVPFPFYVNTSYEHNIHS